MKHVLQHMCCGLCRSKTACVALTAFTCALLDIEAPGVTLHSAMVHCALGLLCRCWMMLMWTSLCWLGTSIGLKTRPTQQRVPSVKWCIYCGGCDARHTCSDSWRYAVDRQHHPYPLPCTDTQLSSTRGVDQLAGSPRHPVETAQQPASLHVLFCCLQVHADLQ